MSTITISFGIRRDDKEYFDENLRIINFIPPTKLTSRCYPYDADKWRELFEKTEVSEIFYHPVTRALRTGVNDFTLADDEYIIKYSRYLACYANGRPDPDTSFKMDVLDFMNNQYKVLSGFVRASWYMEGKHLQCIMKITIED